MKMMCPARRASMLVLALWFLFMLSMFAVTLGHQVRQKLLLTKRLDDRARLHLVFDAAAKHAAAELKKIKDLEFTALAQSWSVNPAFDHAAVGGDVFSLTYVLDSTYGRGAAEEKRFGMVDEERKININAVQPEVLERLFILLGLQESPAQDLAFSIVDWRDKDSEVSAPSGSAEDSYYRNLSTPYEAKDQAFEILQELLLVKGMSPEIFQKVGEYLTVYGRGQVNINTASGVVLQALGLNPEVAEKVIGVRNGKDGFAGTADDRPFSSVSEVANTVAEAAGLNQMQQAQLAGVCDTQLVTVQSGNFACLITAALAGSARTYPAACVLSRSGAVMYWQEQ